MLRLICRHLCKQPRRLVGCHYNYGLTLPVIPQSQSLFGWMCLGAWGSFTCGTERSLQLFLCWLSHWCFVNSSRCTMTQVTLTTIQKAAKLILRTGIFITFAEGLDLCLRSSLPVLLLALSCLAYSVSGSPDQAEPVSRSMLNWHGNSSIPAIDFAKNDALLGSQDAFFWFLIPLFGLVSAGLCVVINYTALVLLHVLCTLYSLLSARPAWIRNDERGYASSIWRAPVFDEY